MLLFCLWLFIAVSLIKSLPLLWFLRVLLIGLYKVVKSAERSVTVSPGDDSRFPIYTCNQSDKLVVSYLCALVSVYIKLVAASCHLPACLCCCVEHDYVAERLTLIPTQNDDLGVVE